MAESRRTNKKYRDVDEVTPRPGQKPGEPAIDPDAVVPAPPVPGAVPSTDDLPVNIPDPLTGLPPDEEPS